MKIAKSLLVISLLASSLVYAGPKFNEAIHKGGLLDTDKKFVGRVRMLALWLSTELTRLVLVVMNADAQSKALLGDKSQVLMFLKMTSPILDLISIQSILANNIEYEGYKLVIDAINEIKDSELKEEQDPAKNFNIQKENFELVKNYYQRLSNEIKNYKKLFGDDFLYAITPDFFNLTK